MSAENTLRSVHQQIRDIQKDQHEPTEIRLGVLDYFDLVNAMEGRSGSLVLERVAGYARLFGLPVRRVPLAHAVSVI